MKNRNITSALAALCLFGLSSPAYAALSCEEIMNMVNVNVPTNIVVQTMKDSNEAFSATDIKCLVEAGAPAEVVSTAKAMAAAAQKAAAPKQDEDLPPPKQSSKSAMDSDSDDIGSRASSTTKKPSKSLEDADERASSGAPDPEQLKTAISLIQAKKPLTASLMLYELLEAGSFPDLETKINYYLARALGDLELYDGAQYHYMQVVKKGTSTAEFKYALPKLISIAKMTGDMSEVARIVPKLSPEDYPSKGADQLHYLMCLRQLDEEDLAGARASCAKVTEGSDLYLRAKYMEGVIYNKQGKLKSAVRAFRDVYREPPGDISDPRELQEIEDLKDLALINIARIYYGIERFGEASKYYELVSHESAFWPQALFENAWAKFMQNDLNWALGQLLTVKSGFFKSDWFMPEAEVLRALTFFNLCQYKEVEKELLGFEDRYRPIQAELKDFVKSYSSEEGKQLADQAWDAYFGPGAKESKLPKSFFTRVLASKDLTGVVSRLESLETERAIIEQQKSRWADTLGKHLLEIMDKDEQRYKKRAGLLLLTEMARQANYLNDLLTQSEIIRFEVVDAQRVDYQYKTQNPESIINYANVTVDFATSVDIIYWPFNGEFWLDELGYYVYTEQATCK